MTQTPPPRIPKVVLWWANLEGAGLRVREYKDATIYRLDRECIDYIRPHVTYAVPRRAFIAAILWVVSIVISVSVIVLDSLLSTG